MNRNTNNVRQGIIFNKKSIAIFQGLPIFSKTNIPHLAGSIIVVFNTFNGVSYGYDFDELANAQKFYEADVLDEETGKLVTVWLKEFPGRWRGDGVVFAYEIAGEYGAG
ncbi:hypothetical protein LCGC14_2975660, partial [marine sediment metagenome]